MNSRSRARSASRGLWAGTGAAALMPLNPGLIEGKTAKTLIAIIENRRLTRCNRPLRLVKEDAPSVIAQGRDGCVRARMAGAYFCPASKGRGRPDQGLTREAGSRTDRPTAHEPGFRPHHHRVTGTVQSQHIQGFPAGQT